MKPNAISLIFPFHYSFFIDANEPGAASSLSTSIEAAPIQCIEIAERIIVFAAVKELDINQIWLGFDSNRNGEQSA
ncbi:MAG: hypothetical protein FJY67_11780 [Calditrichaeota bacterium]|nr:hypothetical protein [Calditrichota bacterium]